MISLDKYNAFENCWKFVESLGLKLCLHFVECPTFTRLLKSDKSSGYYITFQMLEAVELHGLLLL